jgi:hypothetical protein
LCAGRGSRYLGTIWKNWNITMATQQEKLDNLSALLNDILSEKNQDTNIVELSYLKFNGDIEGKGLIWAGRGHTKQFVYQPGPDRFFSSETIDLAKDRAVTINGIKIIDDKELGTSITKSSLREVGRLRGLIVDGSLSVNQFLYYNATSDRLGLGTEEPNAALSICDEGVEIVIGAREYNKAGIGAYNSSDLELITDNTTRITISAGGNIELGNRNNGPIQVLVHGTMGINVGTPDPRTNLHVGGAIKFNDTLHLKGTRPPEGGSFKQGDIVWNSEPQQRHYVGWICIQSGNPGVWAQFGEIR